ncbi:MAG: PilZ domain-containing protein [Thermodesulfobacteriota bacterium]|nr:PilZ domain-containing protein [Thermodesulfobacteriota bacterium]
MKGSAPTSQKETLTGRLKELLRDIYPFIDNASEDQKRELIGLLENLRQRERRRHPRKRRATAVTYATLDRVFKSFIRNIGNGGVFIETSEPLFPGQDVTLSFSFPKDREPVKIAGEIVWTIVDKGIGVKFITGDHNLEAVIESL